MPCCRRVFNPMLYLTINSKCIIYVVTICYFNSAVYNHILSVQIDETQIRNPDQTALIDNFICVYNICHLNTTFKRLIVPEKIVNLDLTAPEEKYDLCFYYYEGHPIKNETFFIVRKSVCVFS